MQQRSRSYKGAVGAKLFPNGVVAAKAEEQLAILDAVVGTQGINDLHFH